MTLLTLDLPACDNDSGKLAGSASSHLYRRGRFLETAQSAGQVLRLWPAVIPRLRPRGNRKPDQVVMLVVSNLRIDPRVERAARAAVKGGYEVVVVCPDLASPPITEQPLDWGPCVSFRPLPVDASRYIMESPWLAGKAMYDAALEFSPQIFHCHDLTTALIGLAAARVRGARCVCDFHEWYSENVSWDNTRREWIAHPSAKRRWFRLAERIAMWRADAVITVCDSIAEELGAMSPFGHRKVEVIRNIPPLDRSGKQYPSLKAELGLPPERFLLLWQGGTGPSRLLEPIIEALGRLPNVTFVIRGPSLDLFGEGYRALAASVGAADRLILLPPVPSADVVDAAFGADAGIWTLPNLSKNFYYALPNKIFEYLASGLPVLAANFPEAIKLVANNGVGLCFDPYDPKSIAEQIGRLSGDKALSSAMRGAIPPLLEKIDAGNEWLKLVRIYERLATRP